MATIIHDYGPIYGEVVNGTVQGRPNGSVYVPFTNTITLELRAISRYVTVDNGDVITCKSDGIQTPYQDIATVVAIAQDLGSNVKLAVCSDSDLNTVVADRDRVAGLFNVGTGTFHFKTGYSSLDVGETYYLVAYLMNNGTPVATSNAIEVVAV